MAKHLFSRNNNYEVAGSSNKVKVNICCNCYAVKVYIRSDEKIKPWAEHEIEQIIEPAINSCLAIKD